jgi:hypothetical protein
MRGRKRIHVTVAPQPGNPPTILYGFGQLTLEASVDEARQLAMDTAEAIVQVQQSGSTDAH